MPTTTEVLAAKEAGKPVDLTRVGCGTCGVEVVRSEWAGHRCSLTPRQEARNRKAMQQWAMAAKFPTIATVCEMCGVEWSEGTHRCSGRKELTPADAAVVAFQQAGAAVALKDLLKMAEGPDGVAS